MKVDMSQLSPRERGVKIVDLAVEAGEYGQLPHILEEQIGAVMNARADLLRQAKIERDGQGNITGATARQISDLTQQGETLAGMVSRVLGYLAKGTGAA